MVYVSDATADGSTIYVGLGYTKDYYICGNRVENCGRSAFNMSGLDGVEVHSNVIVNASTETVGTRSAIVATASTRNGHNNKVRGGLWIKSRTFLNEFTVDDYLRKEVKLIVAKYTK
ncbi:hypothetical protein [Peribacillus frigoritolerans]|uniref:hypothetical protein n=1 Tax=Peribacillus frigoritolerans TaxID=450367 RepID=UPI003F7EA4EF